MVLKKIETYWDRASIEDLDTAETLHKNKKHVPAMFFLHLAVEKKIKSLFMNRLKKEPPFGHNLTKLIGMIPGLALDDKMLSVLSEMTSFNIAARYDDYKNSFFKICNNNFSARYLKKGKEILSWLDSQKM